MSLDVRKSDRAAGVLGLAVAGLLILSSCTLGGHHTDLHGILTAKTRPATRVVTPADEAQSAILGGVDATGWPDDPTQISLNQVGIGLRQACAARLPSDDRIQIEADHTWRRGTPFPTLEETAIVYAAPIGADAVLAARLASIACSSYMETITKTAAGGSSYIFINVATFELPAAMAPGFGYCEQTPMTFAARCTIMIGVGNLACRLRSFWNHLVDARQTVLGLAPALNARCVNAAAMVSTPGGGTASPTPGPSATG
jgi:hypothetical protein